MKYWLFELWNFRELLWVFTAKEIKIRYKQTILGIAWAILQPAALTVIFTLVFSLFLKVDSGSIPYPVFAYSSLLPWTFFSSALSFGSLSIVSNGNLVTKVYFPREIMPFASIGAAFFDFIMATVIFILLLLLYRVPVNLNIFYLLLILPSIIFLTAGISLILATLNVLYRDIRFVVPLALQILLYITPVIYSLDQIPQTYRVFMLLNPLAPLVQGFRDVSALGKSPELGSLVVSCLFSFIIFCLGYWFFKSKEKIFADVI